jgi:hypothetical protein
MKILVLAIGLVLLEAASALAIDDASYTEIFGVIKQISINVHLLVLEVSDGKAVSSEGEKSISVEPETKITVNGKKASLKELKEGQRVKVRLHRDSSKAISIEAAD